MRALVVGTSKEYSLAYLYPTEPVWVIEPEGGLFLVTSQVGATRRPSSVPVPEPRAMDLSCLAARSISAAGVQLQYLCAAPAEHLCKGAGGLQDAGCSRLDVWHCGNRTSGFGETRFVLEGVVQGLTGFMKGVMEDVMKGLVGRVRVVGAAERARPFTF